MKKPLALILGSAVLMVSSGCIVAPTRHGGAVVEPVGVYVAPTYASPGVGWAWAYHPQYGWGWRHPDHGWHRGWR